MNPNCHSFLETVSARFNDATSELLDFGDAAAELQAAATQTVLVPLTHLVAMDAQGEEAQSFLHNQFTSDINHLAKDGVQHSGWCTAKGRMQATFLVWHTSNGYRMTLAADLLEGALKRLPMFILRTKVKLSAAQDTLLLGLAGPQADAALSAAGLPGVSAAMTQVTQDGITVARLDSNRYLLALPADQIAFIWHKLRSHALPAGTAAWRWLDVQAAFPLVTLATKEEFVPQMADFEKIGGVSFHKGCYPGQEIVARTQYLGKVKRHLFRLTAEVTLKAGDVLYSPGNPDQSIGMVMSAAPAPNGSHVALAVLQSVFADDVHLAAIDGPKLNATAVNP